MVAGSGRISKSVMVGGGVGWGCEFCEGEGGGEARDAAAEDDDVHWFGRGHGIRCRKGRTVLSLQLHRSTELGTF